MATTPPPWSAYWPKGVTASQLSGVYKTAAEFPFLKVDTASSYKSFLRDVENNPDSYAAKLSAIFGGPEKYKAAADAYNIANWTYRAELKPDNLTAQTQLENAVKNQLESTVSAEQQGLPVAKSSESILRDQRYNTIRSELENQYNNLVKLDPNAAYRGRAGDLPAIFNQQAAQLADAGVTSITNLKVQNGKLIDSATGKTVSTSNLGGQVAIDRDTGVQKWGDIFSGVEGGANYGIQALEDGSVVLFPAWEKSKSLTSQVLGSDLFKVASLALAGYGLYNLGSALATTGGASTVSAAAGSGLTPGAAGVTGLTPGAAGVTGLTVPAGTVLAPSVGATVAGTAGATGGYGLLDTTDFSRVGETGLIPGSAGEGIQVVVPPGGGAATVPGLEAPGLSAMGGAQGITVPVQGGVVSEMGFVPVGATPSLGDPSSFINNPDYLGSPVISEDYLGLTASDMPSGMGIQDALRMARTGMQLFGPQQQQLLGMGGYGGGGGQAAGVDSSGLLGLLQGKAGVPGVAPLLTPVSIPAAQAQPLLGLQMPQYQPLLGTTTQSLLG